jgi:hypothetical protein
MERVGGKQKTTRAARFRQYAVWIFSFQHAATPGFLPPNRINWKKLVGRKSCHNTSEDFWVRHCCVVVTRQ